MSDPANAKETPNMWERYTALERENAALRHDVERHVKIASDLATELEAARKDAERKKNAD